MATTTTQPTLTPPSDPFSPYVPTDAEPFDAKRLGHLLRRCAFGASTQRLEQWRGKQVSDVIDWLVNYDAASDPLESEVENLEGFVNFTEPGSVASYWFYRMLYSPRPLQERVALFWHNRFATSAAKVDQGRLMHEQIQTFRRLGMGNFRELAVAMGRDPAMLIWLDGQSNRKGKPNENYAREVMELFTLGIGNYTEHDIQELARAFTGWQVQNEQAVFDAKRFDDGEKKVFNKSDNYDSKSAVDLILSQPAAPRHLAKNLLIEFVHPEPTDAIVEHYAQRVRASDWNVKPVVREMISSRLFFSDWAYRSRIKSPVELAVGMSLAMGGKVSTDFLRDQCQRLGQRLLYPPNVKGWPGDKVWINANTVMLRFNFAMQMASQRQREFVRRGDLDGWLKQNEIESANDVMNYFAVLFLDGQMPAEGRDMLIDYMNRDPKGEPKVFRMTAETINSKVRGIMHMMMTMPEYQLA